MKASSISKVTLRQEKLKSGKLSLYLDFYPPIWNPNIKKMSRREFLVCISLPSHRINSRWTTTKPF